jgi:predicted ferric reductase
VSEKVWWYVARAGGLTAWWLLAAAVVWGLALSTRVAAGKVTPPWLLDLHRFLGGLAMCFTGLHVAGLLADRWARFGWSDVLVPLASRWRPVPVALGVVALYLLAAVELTSLLRRRLPRRLWRAVHSSSFALFLLTTGHALTAGSEATNPAVRASAVLMLAGFTFLVAYRAAVGVAAPAGRAE